MDVKGYHVPEGLLYTKEHEWAKDEGASVRVGITEYAAKTLNDVVYVSPPKVGSKVSQFQTMGTVESIKAVSELYSPVSGVVTMVNQELDSHPELVNKSPYSEGWLITVDAPAFKSEKGKLLDAKAYVAHLESVLKE
jgi:glycine cleavage system H protein